MDGQFVVDNTVSVTINRLAQENRTGVENGRDIFRMYSDWGSRIGEKER